MRRLRCFHLVVPVLMVLGAAVSTADDNGPTVRTGRYSVRFSATDGSLAVIDGPAGGVPVFGGPDGLWRAEFQSGTVLRAADFSPQSRTHRFSSQAEGGGLTLSYASEAADVTVRVVPLEDGIDLVAEVVPRLEPLLDLALPAVMRFSPDDLGWFVFPTDGNQAVGAEFSAAFFRAQSSGRPARWEPEMLGPAGYVALFGAPLDQREAADPAVDLRVTPEGRTWLGADVAARVDGRSAVVNRPPARGQADVVVVDSANGPYLSGARLGGSGMLWRVSGGVGEGEREVVLAAVGAVFGRVAERAAQRRGKVGLIALTGGPASGGWTVLGPGGWLPRLSDCAALRDGRAELVRLADVAAIRAALAGDEFAAILNPYGEWLPMAPDEEPARVVAAIGDYVRRGGHWFETGGYPFYYALRPWLFLSREERYPAAFADFMHAGLRPAGLSVYRVQPRTWAPWQGRSDPSAIFIPGRLRCGGDEDGGYFERGYSVFVPPGDKWTAPPVRLTFGRDPIAAVAEYCVANAIRRPLRDKVSPDVLDKLRRAVLVYYAGSCAEKDRFLDRLPVPSLIHFADYLKGAFDKEYPDHLPPNERFGTQEELRAFVERSRRLGHLVMPYTNPTWWCEDPRGPTFRRHGEAPLLRTLDGSLSRERYGDNEGFTICHWHPAVQEANRRTVRQFTEDVPVDILFQDQCGARSWRYDTNPASPSPHAYTEGLLSMVAEDAAVVPLSTENGWDRVLEHEAQLCGMSWGIVPTEHPPVWRRLFRQIYPPGTWRIFPLAQFIGHDKAVMVHHDLGQFATNREILAWTLGLGYGLSYRVDAAGLTSEGTREWLFWLDRLQKAVCARYIGERLDEFSHESGRGDDGGFIGARYGDLRIAANLGPGPRQYEGHSLAGFGFWAAAPGLTAASLEGAAQGRAEFVCDWSGDEHDIWVYARPGEAVSVVLPEAAHETVTVTFDGGEPRTLPAAGGTVAVRVPVPPDARPKEPPAELAGLAPSDWPQGPPAIGVLDFGDAFPSALTQVRPGEWLAALRGSDRLQEAGARVRPIRSGPELVEALTAGPESWFAVVNPYGENFPVPAGMEPSEVIAAIAEYVRRGGCWWETGGYSFYYAVDPDDPSRPGTRTGPAGCDALGIPVGGGQDDPPASALELTDTGRAWLGESVAEPGMMESRVNRPLPRGRNAPEHECLLAAADGSGDYIGGYRLQGWGWLWRVGGFLPEPHVVRPVVVGTLAHLYTVPPKRVAAFGPARLFHATVEPAG